ncbi:MAG TPA: hypothetical protein VFB58_01665 [Chloroflexota bacterium]|nr:hypothetical protein [Chloroflexota bacterium]
MMSRKHAYYRGVRMAPYDLVKEFLVALGVVTLLVVILAAVLSSPDVRPLTLQSIATTDPQSYVQTALNELDGSSGISDYGPPYNNGTGAVQYIGPISIQQLIGVHIPVSTAQDFVLGPLAQVAPTNPSWKVALDRYNAAPARQQTAWTNAYNTALGKATESGPHLSVARCACGPVTTMMKAMLALGQRGAMDGLLLTNRQFYQTDYTRPLLFTADPDNNVVNARATSLHLLGSQWGVMNETGNYPGQAWLWLYSLFYQIPPYTTAWAANTDALAILSITVLSLVLLFLPWIPGLNRLPRYLGVHRLIWRDWYREEKQKAARTAKHNAEVEA